jgi:hypothetical protein
MVEITPMSEWKLREEKVEVPEVAPTVIERVIEKPVIVEKPALITPEEREELKRVVAKSYEIAKKTGEKVYDVLKRKVEEWRETRAKKKLKEAVPEAKVKVIPEKEYVRLAEVKEKKVPEKEIKVPKTVRAFMGWE